MPRTAASTARRRSLRRTVAAGAALGLAVLGLTLPPSASASTDDPACAVQPTRYPAYVVPAGVHFLTIEAYGGAGHPGKDLTFSIAGGAIPITHGGGAGGLGAYVSTMVSVTPGEKIWEGYLPGGDGGGDNDETGGTEGRGGEGIWVASAPWARFCPADGLDLLAVAGGGGGGGGADAGGPGGTGGSAGEPGNPGGDNQNVAGGGGGAGSMGGSGAGGAGGDEVEISYDYPFYLQTPQNPGDPGSGTGEGGSGGHLITRLFAYTDGGGGGGGYYGGGGGGASGDNNLTGESGDGSGGGGGGGSYPVNLGGTRSFIGAFAVFTPTYDSALTFSASPDPGVAGQPVTLTATVTSPIAGQPLGGGDVEFEDQGDPADPGRGTTPLGDVPVDAAATSSTVSVTVPSMTRGYHQVKAYYSGYTGFYVSPDDIAYGVQNAAAGSSFTLDVQGQQSISFTSQPPAATALGARYTPTATSTSGLPVAIDVAPDSRGVCSLADDGVLSYLQGGTCVLDANQVGAALYAAAPQVQQRISVTGSTSQTITFTTTAPATMDGGDTYTPHAVGGGSGNPVVISSGANCPMKDGTVTAKLGGTCAIAANQAAGNGYSAATQTWQLIDVNPVPGHLLFDSTPPAAPQIGDQYTVIGQALYPSYGGGTAILSVDGASTACTMSTPTGTLAAGTAAQEAVVTYTAVGTCIIDVNPSTSGEFDLKASQVQPLAQLQQVSTVAGAAQHITFTSNDPADPTYGGSTTVSATSSSGLPVTFTSATPSTCSVSGTHVAFVGAGECDIHAHQGGDATTWAAAPTVTKKLTIAPAPLTVTAPSGSAVYGTVPTAFTPTYRGFVAGDDSSSLSVRPLCTTSSSSSDAGSHPVTCSGADDPDYTIGYVAGTEKVTPAPVTITASSATTGYGLAVPAVTASYSGFANGDTKLATAPTCGTLATDHSAVGDYATSCTGGADPNYTVSTVDGSITISQADLIITASTAKRSYGDAAPAITASYLGLHDSDTAPATPPTCTSPVDAHTHPGDYVSKCSGAEDPNYTIAYSDGAVHVTPAELTVVAPNPTTHYGTPVAVGPQYEGLAGGDAAPATPAACLTTATSSSPVGTYPVDCSGAADPNYTIVYRSGSVHVTPAPLTLTASSGTTGYGLPVPTVTASYSGLTNGDTAPATKPTCDTSATGHSDVGHYATSCTGGADPNYAITTVDGTISITEANLIITASTANRTYGDAAPSITASYLGLHGSDTAPTTPPTCMSPVDAHTHPGDYASTCSGATDPNYTMAYRSGSVRVTPAPLTITASSARIAWGSSVPAVAPSYSGLVLGQTAPAQPAVCFTAATRHSPTGSYPTACSGAADANYAIGYVAGTMTVAAPTVTAHSSGGAPSGAHAGTPPPAAPSSGDASPGSHTASPPASPSLDGASPGSGAGTPPAAPSSGGASPGPDAASPSSTDAARTVAEALGVLAYWPVLLIVLLAGIAVALVLRRRGRA